MFPEAPGVRKFKAFSASRLRDPAAPGQKVSGFLGASVHVQELEERPGIGDVESQSLKVFLIGAVSIIYRILFMGLHRFERCLQGRISVALGFYRNLLGCLVAFFRIPDTLIVHLRDKRA